MRRKRVTGGASIGSAFAYLLLGPQFLLLLLVYGGPVGYLCWLALLKTDFIARKWVGLENFVRLVTEPVFWRVVVNTGLYALLIVPVSIGSAVIMALLAYDLRRGLRSYLRMTLYLPTLTAGLIIATVWRWIWHPSAGLANWLLSLVGLGPVWWLGGRLSGIFAISVNLIVGNVGFQTMVFLAAILGVGRELLDAARIDGATPWQTRSHVILPIIAPVVALLATLSLIGTAQMWETVMMTTNGGPDYGTATVMFDIYDNGFLRGRFGLAAAETIVLVGLIFMLAVIKQRIEGWRK